MLEEIKIKHLSFRVMGKFPHETFVLEDYDCEEGTALWGVFNIVWEASRDDDAWFSYAWERSKHHTESYVVQPVFPAIDPDNYQDDDVSFERHDLVRMVGFNHDDYVTYLEKFNVYQHLEYAAYSPVTIAAYEELKILQNGGSLGYRTTDDCIFFSHIDTLHNYWD